MSDLRLAALQRFGIAITVLNIAGHLFLGFEASWVQPFTAMTTAYLLEISFEFLDSKINNTRPRYKGGILKFIHFLLPAHITAMAVSMLLFSNERIMPIVFGTGFAILSKVLFRSHINGRPRHFLNPSNIGIVAVLILFPWVGIAPPYQFTENVSGLPDWLLPIVFIFIGTFLNAKLTGRIYLIISWFTGFALQAVFRSLVNETPLLAAINPMTGVAFLLFSFYMISDPATTPSKLGDQIIFGLAVAFCYGILVNCHIVFGQFYALAIVCALRGFYYFLVEIYNKNVATAITNVVMPSKQSSQMR